MFEQILGLPAHPLLVHAAVVFVPLLAAGAIVYAVVPRLRERIRWAVVLLALAAPAAAFSAKQSGDAFRARLVARNLVSAEDLVLIDHHQAFGRLTMLLAIALGVVTLVLAVVVGDRAPVRVGRRSADRPPADSAKPARADGATGGRAESTKVAARHGVRSESLLIQIILGALAVGLAVAAGYYVYRTGDSGARIVWNGK